MDILMTMDIFNKTYNYAQRQICDYNARQKIVLIQYRALSKHLLTEFTLGANIWGWSPPQFFTRMISIS